MSRAESSTPESERPVTVLDLIASEIRSGDRTKMARADYRLSHIGFKPEATESVARRDALVLDMAEAWAQNGKGIRALKILPTLSGQGREQGLAVDGMHRILEHVDATEVRDLIGQTHDADYLTEAFAEALDS